MLQVCLNGSLTRADWPTLPVAPAELARAARLAVAAGARDIHLHPKSPDGQDSLDPTVVAEAVLAVRAAVPGVPVGVTTGAWAMPDPDRRAELVRAWTIRPDHASVNWHEAGADLVAAALMQHGVAVDAGIFSGTDAARRWSRSPLAPRVRRVLAEVTDTDPDTAATTAEHLLVELAELAEQGGLTGLMGLTEPVGPLVPVGPGGPTAAAGRRRTPPVLLHGQGRGAWPVLLLAAVRGLDTRIGLEDVLHLPDGSPAADNATLVAAARAILDRAALDRDLGRA